MIKHIFLNRFSMAVFIVIIVVLMLSDKDSFASSQDIFDNYRHSYALGVNLMYSNDWAADDEFGVGFIFHLRYKYHKYENLIGFYYTIGFVSHLYNNSITQSELYDNEIPDFGVEKSKRDQLTIYAASGPSICLRNDFPIIFLIPSFGAGIFRWVDKINLDTNLVRYDDSYIGEDHILFSYITPIFYFICEFEIIITEDFGFNLFAQVPVGTMKGADALSFNYFSADELTYVVGQDKINKIQDFRFWGLLVGITLTFHYHGLINYILEVDLNTDEGDENDQDD